MGSLFGAWNLAPNTCYFLRHVGAALPAGLE